MIDLACEGLPDTLVVDGEDVRVRTSFRAWIRFGRVLREHRVCDPSVLLDVPSGDWRPAALEFYESPVATPRATGGSGPRTLDLELDGDYVVGSFYQAYGVDLTSRDMHWHLFLALLRSLPGGTKVAEIGRHRAYRREARSQDSLEREAQRQWALPARQDADVVEWQREWFGDVRGGV